MDLFSRLLKERVMFVGDVRLSFSFHLGHLWFAYLTSQSLVSLFQTQVDSSSASLITNQLLFLEAQDAEKPIQMYINRFASQTFPCRWRRLAALT